MECTFVEGAKRQLEAKNRENCKLREKVDELEHKLSESRDVVEVLTKLGHDARGARDKACSENCRLREEIRRLANERPIITGENDHSPAASYGLVEQHGKLRLQLSALTDEREEWWMERAALLDNIKHLRQGLSETQVEAEIPTRGDEYQRLLQAEHQLSRIAANLKIVLLEEAD